MPSETVDYLLAKRVIKVLKMSPKPSLFGFMPLFAPVPGECACAGERTCLILLRRGSLFCLDQVSDDTASVVKTGPANMPRRENKAF